jgi:hypothetical protein
MPRNAKGGGQGNVFSGQHGGYQSAAPPWPCPLCVCEHARWEHFSATGRCDRCPCQVFVIGEGFDESGVGKGPVVVLTAAPTITPKYRWRLAGQPTPEEAPAEWW